MKNSTFFPKILQTITFLTIIVLTILTSAFYLRAQTPDKEEMWCQGMLDNWTSFQDYSYNYDSISNNILFDFQSLEIDRMPTPLYTFDLNNSYLKTIFLPDIPKVNNYRKTLAFNNSSKSNFSTSIYYLRNYPCYVIIYDVKKQIVFKQYPLQLSIPILNRVDYFFNLDDKHFLLKIESSSNLDYYSLQNDTLKFEKSININLDFDNIIINKDKKNITESMVFNNKSLIITNYDFDFNILSRDTMPNIALWQITNHKTSPDTKYIYLSNEESSVTKHLAIFNIALKQIIYETDDIKNFDNSYPLSDNDFFAYFKNNLDIVIVDLIKNQTHEIKYEKMNFLNMTLDKSLLSNYNCFVPAPNLIIMSTLDGEMFEYNEITKESHLLIRRDQWDRVKFSPDSKIILSNQYKYLRAQSCDNGQLFPFDTNRKGNNFFTFLHHSNQLLKDGPPYFFGPATMNLFNYDIQSETPFKFNSTIGKNPQLSTINIELNQSDNILASDSYSDISIIGYPDLNPINLTNKYFQQVSFLKDSLLIGLEGTSNGFIVSYRKKWDYIFYNLKTSISSKLSIPYTKPQYPDPASLDSSFINFYTIRDTMVVSNAAPGDSANLYYMFNQNVFIKKPTNDFFRGRVADFQFIPNSRYALVLTRNCRLYAVNTDNIDEYREIKYTGVDMISSIIQQYNRWTGYLKISPDGSRAYLRTTFTEHMIDLSEFSDVKDEGEIGSINLLLTDKQIVLDYLDIKTPIIESSQLDFYSIEGRKVKSLNIQPGQIKIYVGDLPLGAYFANINNTQNKNLRIYFIKQ